MSGMCIKTCVWFESLLKNAVLPENVLDCFLKVNVMNDKCARGTESRPLSITNFTAPHPRDETATMGETTTIGYIVRGSQQNQHSILKRCTRQNLYP